MSSDFKKVKGISIVLCGAAGQGIKTVEKLLVHALKSSGYHVFASREYMSRVRGGNNSTEIRVSREEVCAFVDRVDILIALSPGIRPNIMERVSKETLIIGDKDNVGNDFSEDLSFYDAAFLKEARELGGRVYANSIAAGVIFGILNVSRDIVKGMFEQIFSSKGGSVVEKNMDAAEAGILKGEKIRSSNGPYLEMISETSREERIALDGSEAVSLGAIAGGCNFIASYPMSPATGVLTYLASHARDFDIVAEQIEDEIAAINSAVGASYAGARSMVSTSGGGFALMSEGLSLAGVMETPVVVHLAQRPGPATGMATRTEQGDLNLAVYSGHGEFPRIVLAPATIEDGFYLMKRAFDLADRYQVPVILLTDQYYLNTFYDVPVFDVKSDNIRYHIIEADNEYRRYEITGNGISPRSVPGYGPGLVGADSHEHDPWGHVQEDFVLRKNMVEKRLKKLEDLKDETIPSYFSGAEDFKYLVISWGSTYPVIEEALELLDHDDVAHIHLRQIYPLENLLGEHIKRAKKTITIEGNATGQLAMLIKQTTGFSIDTCITGYRGLQFSVEEICNRLEAVFEGKEE